MVELLPMLAEMRQHLFLDQALQICCCRRIGPCWPVRLRSGDRSLTGVPSRACRQAQRRPDDLPARAPGRPPPTSSRHQPKQPDGPRKARAFPLPCLRSSS
jgi:hypothetical protein